MLIRSVPVGGGATTSEQLGGDTAIGRGSPSIAAPRAGLDLPCCSGDTDLWFAGAPAQLEQAKALCGRCPIQAECLAGALRRAEPWGVWGGEIFERGTVTARKRPRGRPRKIDLTHDRTFIAAGA